MYDKFQGLPGPIAKGYRDWEADAIEACRNDPSVAAAGLCPVCMIKLPVCHCVNLCRHCGKPFGEYACQCPGPFESAFDKKSGERIYPPPSEVELRAIENAIVRARREYKRDSRRGWYEKRYNFPWEGFGFSSWCNDATNKEFLARIYRGTRVYEKIINWRPKQSEMPPRPVGILERLRMLWIGNDHAALP